MLQRLEGQLNAQGISYALNGHAPAFTSAEAASARKEPLRLGAKAVVVNVDGRIAFFVVPGDRMLCYKTLYRQMRGGSIRLATREELRQTIGLEGGIPPFGSLFGFQTICDARLQENETISFNVGDECVSMTMTVEGYVSSERPLFASISKPAREK